MATGRHDERTFRRHHRLELAATVLLSFATFGSAWAAWRSSVWNGVQAAESSRATHYLTESVRASTLAHTQETIDVATWLHWLQTMRCGDEHYAADLASRFRPEFRRAFEAWLGSAAEGVGIPPDSPFVRGEYQQAQKEAYELQRLSEDHAQRATLATETSNDFVLTAVLYASVLFLAGISLKVEAYRIRLALVGLAAVVLCLTLLAMAVLPALGAREPAAASTATPPADAVE